MVDFLLPSSVLEALVENPVDGSNIQIDSVPTAVHYQGVDRSIISTTFEGAGTSPVLRDHA